MGEATCPYCRSPFAPDDEVVTCSGCATQHHTDCLEENGGCTVFGCSQAPAEEPRISISDRDVAADGRPIAPPSAPASFLNLNAGAASPPPSSVSPTPPPPRPTPAPPPPRLGVPGAIYTSQPAVMTYPTFAGYAPVPIAPVSGYEPRKSRVVFVLLAVLLGAFGGHNFYAGYVKKAVIQLCITLFSCFTASFVSWVWAVVEACVVDRDDDGVAFV